jgi:hypothetical protein
MPRCRDRHGGVERGVPPVGAGHVAPLPVGVVGVMPAAGEPPELARIAGPEAVEADLVKQVHLGRWGDRDMRAVILAGSQRSTSRHTLSHSLTQTITVRQKETRSNGTGTR